MSVKENIMALADGEVRNRIFFSPDIPRKKLDNARSKFITRSEEVLVLVDDTLFGSSKDGLAITEKYLYAKQAMELAKSVKISSIRNVSGQSNRLGSLDIFINGNLFVNLSTIDKADHNFIIDLISLAQKSAKALEPTSKNKPSSKAVKATGTEKSTKPEKAPQAGPCLQCGASLASGAKFCHECGGKVQPKDICSGCGGKLPAAAKFCPGCGQPAGQNTVREAEPVQDAASSDQEAAVKFDKVADDEHSNEALSAESPDFYDAINSVDIDPAENARSLINGNPRSSDLLSAAKTFLERVVERCGHHEDFLRDACAPIASVDGPYRSILGKAYEYSSGETYDPDDEYISVSFDDLAGYVAFSDDITSDVIRYEFLHRMLEALVQSLEHAGEWDFVANVDDVPDLDPRRCLPELESKIAATIAKLSS